MFFSKSNEGTKVLEAACKAGGIQLDKGRIIGSPERLNLFTIEGDLLRVDLDLEAHLGSTLQPSSVLILEKVRRASHLAPRHGDGLPENRPPRASGPLGARARRGTGSRTTGSTRSGNP